MEHRVTPNGIETMGVLTPWSRISSITLAREPEVTYGGAIIAPGYWMIVVDLVTGDFLEIAEGTPSWDAVVEGLPEHRTLLVDDLAGMIAAGGTETTMLWPA